MRIISTVAPTGQREHFFVFDTFADGKAFTVAVVQSPDGGQQLTKLGQQVVDFARAHHDAKHGELALSKAIHIVQVYAGSTARAKVVSTLGAAQDGDLILFIGINDAACAALIKPLGVTGHGVRRH